MTGLDIFLLLIVVGACGLGAFRGFGAAVLDLFGVYSALLLSSVAAPFVQRSIPNGAGAALNSGDVHVVTFVVLVIVALVLSHICNGFMNWDIGSCNTFAGGVAGLAIGAIAAHGIVAGLALGDPQQIASISGAVSQQMLTFSNFHDTVNNMASFTGPRPDNF